MQAIQKFVLKLKLSSGEKPVLKKKKMSPKGVATHERASSPKGPQNSPAPVRAEQVSPQLSPLLGTLINGFAEDVVGEPVNFGSAAVVPLVGDVVLSPSCVLGPEEPTTAPATASVANLRASPTVPSVPSSASSSPSLYVDELQPSAGEEPQGEAQCGPVFGPATPSKKQKRQAVSMTRAMEVAADLKKHAAGAKVPPAVLKEARALVLPKGAVKVPVRRFVRPQCACPRDQSRYADWLVGESDQAYFLIQQWRKGTMLLQAWFKTHCINPGATNFAWGRGAPDLATYPYHAHGTVVGYLGWDKKCLAVIHLADTYRELDERVWLEQAALNTRKAGAEKPAPPETGMCFQCHAIGWLSPAMPGLCELCSAEKSFGSVRLVGKTRVISAVYNDDERLPDIKRTIVHAQKAVAKKVKRSIFDVVVAADKAISATVTAIGPKESSVKKHAKDLAKAAGQVDLPPSTELGLLASLEFPDREPAANLLAELRLREQRAREAGDRAEAERAERARKNLCDDLFQGLSLQRFNGPVHEGSDERCLDQFLEEIDLPPTGGPDFDATTGVAERLLELGRPVYYRILTPRSLRNHISLTPFMGSKVVSLDELADRGLARFAHVSFYASWLRTKVKRVLQKEIRGELATVFPQAMPFFSGGAEQVQQGGNSCTPEMREIPDGPWAASLQVNPAVVQVVLDAKLCDQGWDDRHHLVKADWLKLWQLRTTILSLPPSVASMLCGCRSQALVGCTAPLPGVISSDDAFGHFAEFGPPILCTDPSHTHALVFDDLLTFPRFSQGYADSFSKNLALGYGTPVCTICFRSSPCFSAFFEHRLSPLTPMDIRCTLALASIVALELAYHIERSDKLLVIAMSAVDHAFKDPLWNPAEVLIVVPESVGATDDEVAIADIAFDLLLAFGPVILPLISQGRTVILGSLECIAMTNPSMYPVMKGHTELYFEGVPERIHYLPPWSGMIGTDHGLSIALRMLAAPQLLGAAIAALGRTTSLVSSASRGHSLAMSGASAVASGFISDRECRWGLIAQPSTVVSVSNVATHSRSHALFALKSNADAPFFPLLLQVGRLLAAESNSEHAGHFTCTDYTPALLATKRRALNCGCFECRLREWYGPVFIVSCGTEGDRRPLNALGRALASYGLDVTVVNFAQGSGEEYLKAVSRGRCLELAPVYLEAAFLVGSLPGLTIGPPELDPSIQVSLAPPLGPRNPLNMRMGHILNPLFAFFSGLDNTMWRIASYPGLLNLPRSADGVNFLKPVPRLSGERPIVAMSAMGSAGFPPVRDTVPVTPGDHFSQFKRAQVVYHHGGAGTAATVEAAGAIGILCDDSLDRACSTPLDTGTGMSFDQPTYRVLSLFLGVDYLPLLLAARFGVRAISDAALGYLKLFGVADLVTITVALSLATRSIVLVPGSFLLSLATSFLGYFVGLGTSAFICFCLMVWGQTLLLSMNVSVSGSFMRLIRLGRLSMTSPTLMTVGLAAGLKPFLIVAFILKALLPLAISSRMAWRKPRSYLNVYLASGMPVHVAFSNQERTKEIEGRWTLVGGEEAYVLRERKHHRSKPLFSIPTLLEYSAIDYRAAHAAPYLIFTNNCQTQLLTVITCWRQLGVGLLFLLCAGLIAMVVAGAGFLVLLTIAVLTPMVASGTFFAPTEARNIAISFLSRSRRARLISHLGETSFSRFLLLAGTVVMDTAAGLEGDDLRAFNAFNALRAYATSAVSITPDSLSELHDILAMHPIIRSNSQLRVVARILLGGLINFDLNDALIEPTVEDARLTTIYENLSVLSKPLDRISPVEFGNLSNWMQEGSAFWDLEDEERACFLPFFNLATASLALFHDTPPDEMSPEVRELIEGLDGLLPDSDRLDEVFKAGFACWPVWGCGPDSSAEMSLRLGELGDLEAKLLEATFFRLENLPVDDDGVVDIGSLRCELSKQDINALGFLTATGLQLGLHADEAVTQAVLNMKDILHPVSRPANICEAAEAHIAGEAYLDAAHGIRKFIAQVVVWWHKLERWSQSNHVARTAVAPLLFFLSVVGTIIGAVFSGLLRLLAVILVSLGQAVGQNGLAPSIMTTIVLYLQTVDFRNRLSPKPAWALLWKRLRYGITKGEAMLMNLRPASFKPTGSYPAWAELMKSKLIADGIDSTVLHSTPPERMVFYPAQPVGVDELNEYEEEIGHHFTSTADARRVFQQHLEAGGKLTIDGAYLGNAETVSASISRYLVPRPATSVQAHSALTHAAEAIASKHPELYDAPMPMTVAQTAKMMKWKYSAGLPFLPIVKKKEALRASPWFNAIINAAESILESGELPEVALHAFPKNQIVNLDKVLDDRSALRTVTAGDRIMGVVINSLLLERNKRVAPSDYGHINYARRSEGGFAVFAKDLSRFNNHFKGDGKRFDSTAASAVSTVGSTRLYEVGVERLGLPNTQAAVSIVKAYYEALTAGIIVNLADGSYIIKTGGGGTGSQATTPDNRDWVELVFIASWELTFELPAHQFYDHVVFTHASDDVTLSCDDLVAPRVSEWMTTMHDEFGVIFEMEETSVGADMLHLKSVKPDDFDMQLYRELGAEIPQYPMRHCPKRLLQTRSAFRADRMKLNQVVAASHIAERSCGYQLLCCHNRDEYDLVTTDLMHANLAFAQMHFTSAEGVLIRSDDGHILDQAVTILDSSPPQVLRNRVARLLRGNQDPQEFDRLIAKMQRRAHVALKQRRGSSYKRVFEAWVSTPPAVRQSKAYRRWRNYADAAGVLNPVITHMRVWGNKLNLALESIPKGLMAIVPESDVTALPRPFSTGDFLIEEYIFRRFIHRHARPPSFEEMVTLIRECPFAAATHLDGFFSKLSHPKVLVSLIEATQSNCQTLDYPLVGSNDELAFKICLLVIIYSLIDVLISWAENVPVLGFFVILGFSVFRWLDVFYSFQSLLFWIGTGMASLAISNTMVKDKYALQKIIAASTVACLPRWLTRYAVGLFRVLPWLSKFVEKMAFIPNMMNSIHAELVAELRAPSGTNWAPYLESPGWACNNGLIVAGTGYGKSTTFVSLVRGMPRVMQVVLLVPFNRLVTEYTNPDSLGLVITRIVRGDPSDEVWHGDIIVMTYSQFALRVDRQAPVRGVVVLFDEAHEPDSSAFVAYAKCLEKGFKVRGLTATPHGPLCDVLTAQGHNVTLASRARFARVQLPGSVPFSKFLLSAIKDGVVEELLVYSPSIRVLEGWAKTTSANTSNIRFATSLATPGQKPGPIFGTGVIAVGVNLRPPPIRLGLRPTKLIPTINPAIGVWDEIARVRMVPILQFGALTTLQEVGLLPHELHQLVSRVGREKDGQFQIIGDIKMPVPSFRWSLRDLAISAQVPNLVTGVTVPTMRAGRVRMLGRFHDVEGFETDDPIVAGCSILVYALESGILPSDILTMFNTEFKTEEGSMFLREYMTHHPQAPTQNLPGIFEVLLFWRAHGVCFSNGGWVQSSILILPSCTPLCVLLV